MRNEIFINHKVYWYEEVTVDGIVNYYIYATPTATIEMYVHSLTKHMNQWELAKILADRGQFL